MQFEWDDEKNQRNIEKHGVSFELAIQIFDHPRLDRVDDRRDYGETRTISLGIVENVVVLTVVHTARDGRTRLISARRASRKERALYYAKI
ncbi:BrnT family toxin [Palleronia caenipelagi]|uniref:BrnT family toxin n=1 Tax=Palleronia caenipelagi TaxID=2489174 RepID=A0A547PT31_9RHOB|nr:BrnT family toxin [Palleronia caenipelagi]TRD17295.1 BrnT family toxin [Palleronia caenipelagi]